MNAGRASLGSLKCREELVMPKKVAVFMDGTGITPGTEKCVCDKDCEFPCWQRLGWAPPCESCGCAQRGMKTQ